MFLLYQNSGTCSIIKYLLTQFFVPLYTVFCTAIHSFLYRYNSVKPYKHSLFFHAKEQKIKIYKINKYRLRLFFIFFKNLKPKVKVIKKRSERKPRSHFTCSVHSLKEKIKTTFRNLLDSL